jgi:hypothetical protein
MTPMRGARLAFAAALLVAALPLRTESPPQRQLYDTVIETGMPHLEENLRYTTVRERRCVDTAELGNAFPVLRDVALQDCRLEKATQESDRALYVLQCAGGHGTAGQARWTFDGDTIAGTLDVRLGGKNMTFYQRITGRRAGAC